VVSQTQPSPAELFPKDPILLAQVFDHLELLLVHPAGHCDQYEPERIQNLGHLVYCRELQLCAPELAGRQADPVSGPYGRVLSLDPRLR
jgi:hypothetical protein